MYEVILGTSERFPWEVWYDGKCLDAYTDRSIADEVAFRLSHNVRPRSVADMDEIHELISHIQAED